MGRELTGALAIGPDIAPVLVEGGSSKQVVTEQREELCQALLPHPDQMARPVIAYGQFDKISTAWELSLPEPTTGLTSPVFTEVVAIRDVRGGAFSSGAGRGGARMKHLISK